MPTNTLLKTLFEYKRWGLINANRREPHGAGPPIC